MTGAPHALWLADCTAERAPLVGGKALGLGALVHHGLQVPPGFTLTTAAYREHVEHNHLAADLERLLADCTTFEAQQRAADDIAALFETSRPTPTLEAALRAHYDDLCARSTDPSPVAVRSSATAEDTASASFAGQQATYLWILGYDEVLRHVVRCWASLFTAHAIAYRAHMRSPVADLAMAVVVQHMVPADAAGVMMTIDPVSGDATNIVIESAFGLGAAIVNGEVDPDRFCVDKTQMHIRSRSVGTKKVAYRFDPTTQGTRLQDVAVAVQTQPSVTDAEVLQLARIGQQMEQAMGMPQDIEWAVGPGASSAREVFMLQARPETVWSQKPAAAAPPT